MYENYSRQALPSKKYRELLGSAICVFNSNNAFVIENILRIDDKSKYDWYDLIDSVSGRLKPAIEETITKASDYKIAVLFHTICATRNRIVHSFQITDIDGEQRLATKDKDNRQYTITEKDLIDFIKGDYPKLCVNEKQTGFEYYT